MVLAKKSLCEIYAETEHEEIVLWADPTCDYRGIIAIHSTVLGPAVGGTRYSSYSSDEAASQDALRLSRAMSYKNALAGLPFGGGKAIIIDGNRSSNREKIFRAHGRFIESLGGRFITGEDLGTRPSDMEYVRMETRHVAGLPDKSGDPSLMTARGVFRGLQALAMHVWGSADWYDRTVAIQGCGSTGYNLAKELHEAGAKLLVSDLDTERLRRVVDECGATAVAPDEIVAAPADIFAPCALGGIINDFTIPRLKVGMIAGSANNQLLESRHGEVLHEIGILYAPDYVINAGGVINGCRELLGWQQTDAMRRVDGIYETMLSILESAQSRGIPPFRVADELAEMRLNGRGLNV